MIKKNFHTTQQKLNFTKKATEQVLVENISNPNGYIEDPVLIGVYSATLNEEEIDLKDSSSDNEDSRSRRETFLKSMKDKIDFSNPEHKERYLQVENKILDKVKATQTSRSRSKSVSSITSKGSKRDRSGDQDCGSSPVRHRKSASQLPVKTQ